ncbi:hypothetical protein [Bradyrhizobium sp. ARR65]|uniref:hypothetical protein n=1 Tax=Bradyrhizobium sp. ARR65 TaxID=1040989 RepID=UPI00046337B0|nr:hypothetical protein [Bradyrhizobium sp. ARR65]
MPRKLKSYQTSLGFYDLAIAAPSMKAALEGWGAESNLFHQGVAKEADDPDVIAATMAKPGVVLRRPVGSTGPFREHASLPSHLPGADVEDRTAKALRQPKKQAPRKIDDKAARKAAKEFEKAQRQRQAQRRKEEAAQERERERRESAIEKAQAALDRAQREHEARAGEIEAEREAIEKRAQAEDARWEKQREKLQAALRRARE